jgi:NAD(P)-dependent dehydrogenase (short-subunit alcohol dehydrogenase family)
MSNDRKNFLITGGARGIGRGLARQLLSSGHRIFLVDTNTTELNHTSALLAKTHAVGTDFSVLHADVSDPAAVKRAVAQAKTLFGEKLHCLVNNAAYTGGVGGVAFKDMTVEEWNKSLGVNLTGTMLVTQACLPLLTAGKGCVVNISSTRAKQSEPNNEAYSTTKAGLLGLTQSLSVSLAEENIRVNAIIPGWIHVENECKEADEQGKAWDDGLSKEDQRWHLTGRVGKVEDISKAVEYLSDADGVTGTEMVVDGGVSRRMVYPE